MACRVQMSRPMTKRATSRGFTLVELGVVVAIVGILAVIAVVGYRKIVLSSKLTEARHIIGGIRIAEEDYKADTGAYLDLGGVHCPSDGMTEAKFAWDNPSCNSGLLSQLNVHADGPVRFGYAVWAGNTVTQPGGVSSTLLSVGTWAGKQMPYYVVHAQADLNPNIATNTELATASMNAAINVINEGD